MDVRGRKEEETGENSIIRNLIICNLHQILESPNKGNELGEACITHRGYETCIQNVKSKILRGRYHEGELQAHRRIIFKRMLQE